VTKTAGRSKCGFGVQQYKKYVSVVERLPHGQPTGELVWVMAGGPTRSRKKKAWDRPRGKPGQHNPPDRGSQKKKL